MWQGRSGPTLLCEVDGKLCGWCDGLFFGDHMLIAKVKQLAETHLEFLEESSHQKMVTGSADMLSAYAAFLLAAPGRVLLRSAPEEFIENLLASGDSWDEGVSPENNEYPTSYLVDGVWYPHRANQKKVIEHV